MRITPAILVFVALIFLIANPATAEPENDVKASYRAFVEAIRKGDATEALKYVQWLTEEDQPLMEALIAETIAADAIQMEMLKQWARNPADGGWEPISFIPWDDMIQELRVQISEDGTSAGVFAIDNDSSGEGLAATMIRHNEHWVISSADMLDRFDVDIDELTPEVRLARIERAEKATAVYKSLIKGLWAKEYKSAHDFQAALNEARKLNRIDALPEE